MIEPVIALYMYGNVHEQFMFVQLIAHATTVLYRQVLTFFSYRLSANESLPTMSSFI